MAAKPRPDLFTSIHKALRLMLYELAADMQRADFTQSEQEAEIITRLNLCMELLEEHGVHEDKSIFPAVQVMEPGTLRMLTIDHEQLGNVASAVSESIESLRIASITEKPQAGAALLRLFNTLVAAQLGHMNREEETALPATWKYLSDEQIVGIRTRIQTGQSPERYRIWLRMMMRALSDGELSGMYAGAKLSAPPAVVELIDGVASEELSAARYQAIIAQAAVIHT